MKALVMTDYNKFELTDLEKPSPGKGEVLVRVKACAICGSDVHGADGSTGRRIPPVLMGHEASGVVEEIGEGVTDYSPGMRVTFDSTSYCGVCAFCKAGEVNLCDDREVFGVSCAEYRKDGAFAEYVAVGERLLYPLPDNVTFEQGAMIEPLAIALHAVGRPALRPTDTAVIVGSGIIGQLIVAALKTRKINDIIAVDIDDGRLAAAAKFGASHTVNSASADAYAEIMKLTGNKGADVSFEAVGISETVGLAVNCLRKGGSAVWVGNLAKSVDAPLQSIVTRQISIFGSCACAGEYAESLELISGGAVSVDALLSLTAPLSEGASMFARLKSGKENLLKVVLIP